MRNKNLLGTLQLLLASFIWGSTFMAQDVAMDHMGPLTFLSVRFFIGGIVLLPVVLFRNLVYKNNVAYKEGQKGGLKALFIGGAVCGVILTFASGLQQLGMFYDASPGKSGFLTTLYVIFVPLCGIFFKKLPSLNVWLAVIIATVGLYLLCMSDSLMLNFGEFLVLLCALVYTAHIMVIDRFSEQVDPIKLSCVQFFTVGVVALPLAFIFETPTVEGILSAWLPLLYAGLLSSGVAFTLQVVAQRYTEPTIAAITMSFESVFAVLTDYAFAIFTAGSLGHTLSGREWIGCAVMFIAIILAQFPANWFRLKKRSV